MTRDQALIAVPLLNSYAHQFLGLTPGEVQIAGAANRAGGWTLIVARGDMEIEAALDFDTAKALIDELGKPPIGRKLS